MSRRADPTIRARRALAKLDEANRLYCTVPMDIAHPALTLALMQVEHARAQLNVLLRQLNRSFPPPVCD
ncbi:hypothetical protein [Chitinimonas sp.]|uniref:hypothetical protein n=1 Tax=Chitinimonas sp. TaxID=1934313 RepID=UPI0035ADD0A7